MGRLLFLFHSKQWGAPNMKRPLEGILVLEFAQYLAAPLAGLRLADLGARVIKVERPNGGDAGRQLTTKNLFVDGDSIIFHAINRNKESFTANLKSPDDLAKVKRLIARADVMTHNFRPGVMEKIGLDYASVRALNPRLVYGVVTGYGEVGPWCDKPGQDLLAQAMSGLTHLTGSADSPPTPFGLAVGDILCGTHFAQGLLAALVRRGRTGQGALVEASLLESLLDVQFEVLTTHFNDGGQPPRRAQHRNAHAYLGAPYGIYRTQDGWLALAMGELSTLGKLIGCDALVGQASSLSSGASNTQRALGQSCAQPDRLEACPTTSASPLAADAFQHRDEIKTILAAHLKTQTTARWLGLLEAADYWCADVFNYAKLMAHDGFKSLGMDQVVRRANGAQVRTLRCPVRIDGERLYSDVAAPTLGNATANIEREFLHA